MSKTRTRDMDKREGHWEEGYGDLHGKEREGGGGLIAFL